MIKESKNSHFAILFYFRNFFLNTILENLILNSCMVWNIIMIFFSKENFEKYKNLNSVLNCLLNYSDKKCIF